MKVIDQSYEIDYFNKVEDVRRITRGARICYKSKPLNTYEEQCAFIERQLLKGDLDNPHHSPLEHSSLSVVFTTNRGITHELVRHRIMSPNQESSRYCRYDAERFDGNVIFIRDIKFKGEELVDWLDDCSSCEKRYFRRLDHGHTTDEARGVLNNDVKSEIMITANYREWRHILKLRTSKGAHYMMVDLMQPLKEYLISELPCAFGDL